MRAAALLALSAAAAANALVAAPTASAATCTTTAWQGASGGSWTDPGNWDSGVPDAAKIASIPGQSAPITGLTGQVCGLTATGDVALDGSLQLAGAATVDIGTATVTITGGTWSLPDSAQLNADVGTPGTLRIASGASISLGGVVTTAAVVQVSGGATLTAASASTLKQSASGELDLAGGTLSGDLTLNVLTLADGTISVPGGSRLTVTNVLELRSGSVVLDGTLRNSGIVRLYDGTTLTSPANSGILDSGSDPLFPATLYVGTDSIYDPGSVTLTGVSLRNSDKMSLDAGMRLVLTGASGASTSSSLLNGSVLTSPQPAAAGQAAGTLVVSQGSALTLQGKVSLQKGITLALSDGTDGTSGRIIGQPDGIVPATLTAASAADGAFVWGSGTVTGPLSITGGSVTVSSSGGSDQRFLAASAGSTGPALTLAADSTFTAGLRLSDNATISVAAKVTLLTGAATFFSPTGSLSGQSMTVAPGATVRRLPANGAGPDETGTVSVPLVNNGTLELDASLTAAAGYSQRTAANAPSGAAAPLTALLSGATLAAPSAVSITAGGIGGKGTVQTPTLSLQNGWIAPGYRAKCHEVDATVAESCVGTVTVQGALHLSSTSDVQVVVRSDTDHDTLASTGAATLAGKLTVATGINYKPAAGFTASKLVRYSSRTGSFATTASPAAPVGFGWRPSYDDSAAGGRGVDATLVDNEAPVMGFAGIPAFTQQNVIEVVYAAVDNSSGVASYDVRWRRVGLTGAFEKWVYPKAWQRTKKKTEVITGAAEGYTYCAAVRARDNAGNVSKWTPAPCSAVQLDDRFLKAVGAWTRVTGRAKWYDKTFSRTTARGATLSKYATFTRIALSALHCPTCGKVQIYAGKTLIKTLDLHATKFGRTNFVSNAVKLRTARVYIKVVSRHRLVQIDALGMLH